MHLVVRLMLGRDGATVLVDLPPSLLQSRLFTIFTVPYRPPYRLDGSNSLRRRTFTTLNSIHVILTVYSALALMGTNYRVGNDMHVMICLHMYPYGIALCRCTAEPPKF